MKPLRDRGFAGMLPRTMSQGNDAFTPKDAATDASKEGSVEDAAKSDSAKSDSVKSDSAKSDSAKSDSSSDREASVQDEKRRDDREPSGSTRRASSKSSRRAPRDEDEDERLVPPQSEDEIDVPKKYTIYMLGAMSALTIVLWFAAKLTCNVHPDQVREPKHFSTRDLAADPKNAAFEFHHKFETADYVTALDLSTGEMNRIVEGKLKECEQHLDDCVDSQKKLAGTIESSAKVLERSENRATVEMTSVYKGTLGSKTFAFEVVKEGEFWRVASRRDVATAKEPQAVSPAVPNAPASAAPVEMADPAASPAP